MIKKLGSELTSDEVSQINEASLRDFKTQFKIEDAKGKLYFLLIEGEKLIAFGALGEVKSVVFNGENFSIYGVYNVISNAKGKGFGKQVVVEITDYLSSNNLTGLGFCMPHNAGFYKNCGFNIEADSTQRFVYTKDGKSITNLDGQVIFYQDGSDKFMEKVLKNPQEEVSLPTDNLW